MGSIPHIAERVIATAPGAIATTATAASFTAKTDGLARVFVRIATNTGTLQLTDTLGTSLLGTSGSPGITLTADAVNGPFYHPVTEGVAYSYQPIGATVTFEQFVVDVTNH